MLNAFDVAVVVLALGGAIGGYRLGLVTRVVSWIGLIIGCALAIRLLPALLARLQGWDPTWLLGLTLLTVVIGASIGQSLGFALGARIQPVNGVARADRSAGAVAGVCGVVAVAWLLLPVVTSTPGRMAEQAHSSVIAQRLSNHLPDAPDSMETLRAIIGRDNFPRVFDALRPTPDLGPPPADSGLSAGTKLAVSRAVVKVEGIACGRVQDGTGFVIGNDLVATNAHVVAGERETEVERDDKSRAAAQVVAFDSDRDLAILRVPGLNRTRLPLAPSALDAAGGVFGHPGGGTLRIAPFTVARQIQAIGRDIYGDKITSRSVLELRSTLRPGDSGSAIVDRSGAVVGVAFAIAPDRPDVAYALTTAELETVMAGDLSAPVSTGRCTTD